ncbi:MAG: hypothetical protein RLZZ618_3707 [Pseudomonadota bacterium]
MQFHGARLQLERPRIAGRFVANFVSASGINDAGQFVANAPNGHAYLVSLVPEPGQLALWAAGIGLLGAAARRRSTVSSAAAARPSGS